MDEEKNTIIIKYDLRKIPPSQTKKMSYCHKVMCGCKFFINAKKYAFFHVVMDRYLPQKLKHQNKNDHNRRSV